jgi:hypothetical protein
MAIYNAGYLSPIRKKLGNAVGRKWRTLNVLAVYQPNVSNPNTEAQQMQRNRFRDASQMAMRAAGVLGIGMESYCRGNVMPPRAAFMHINYPNFRSDGDIEYAEMQFSYGALDAPVIDGPASVSTPLKVSYHLNNDFVESLTCSSHDVIYICAYDPMLKRMFVTDSPVVRGDDEINLTFPSLVGGHRVHCYLFAVGKDHATTEGKTSMTVYGSNPTITAA